MATQFWIEEKDYASLKDQVVVLTGGASGIGLATTKVLLSVGAKVVSGDVNEPPITHENLSYLKTDVTSWDSLLALFDHAKSKHGDIHHIFANAGISGRADYLSSTISPTTQKLLEPPTLVFDINLRGMLNTAYIGLHHLRTQNPSGPTPGSIVLTASGSSFQPFGVTDYTTTKHAVLGFQRGLLPNLIEQKLPIRINSIGPSWTETGLVPKELCQAAGIESQPAEVVGKQVATLMAGERQGEFIYSVGGRNYEIEQGVLLPAAAKAVGGYEVREQEAYERLKTLAANFGVDQATKERQEEVAGAK